MTSVLQPPPLLQLRRRQATSRRSCPIVSEDATSADAARHTTISGLGAVAVAAGGDGELCEVGVRGALGVSASAGEVGVEGVPDGAVGDLGGDAGDPVALSLLGGCCCGVAGFVGLVGLVGDVAAAAAAAGTGLALAGSSE